MSLMITKWISKTGKSCIPRSPSEDDDEEDEELESSDDDVVVVVVSIALTATTLDANTMVNKSVLKFIS